MSRRLARSSASTTWRTKREPLLPTMTRTFVIGARGSALSLRQVEIVVAALREVHPDLSIQVRQIKTEGDRSSAPLSQIGGLGVFTKTIEDSLLAGTIDIAVHSLK